MATQSSNRTQITQVIETVLGTTPATPRMRTKIVTGESLTYAPSFADSAELRSDRMTSDSIMVGLDSGGSLNWEFHYPAPNSPEDADIQSAFFNPWTNTPVRDNDGTPDSVITDIGTTASTLTCTTGAAFVLGHLVRTTGFAQAANNTVAKVTTGGTTSYVATGAGYVAEAAPPGTARAKVVGFQGAAADITATATGLASTTLDFTTLGLIPGQWIKIGGSGAGNKFATAPCNAKARVTAIAAHALTCDNLPSGWTIDAGVGKTISVWFGDQIKNGVTTVSQSIERGYLAQAIPSYILQPGMVASQWQISLTAKQIITGTTTYMGMTASMPGTTTVDASPDPAPSSAVYPQFAASANVGRVAENGVTLTSPNWCTALDVTIANNIAAVESLDAVGPQDLVGQECTVTGNSTTIFGDTSILTRFFAGTPTSLSAALQKGSQMVILSIPRATYTGGGSPNATGKNQLVTAKFSWKASKDETLTNAIICMDRLEYFEN